MAKLLRRRCLVTGAGKGLGEAIAAGLAAEGAYVAILDIDLSRPKLVSEKLLGLGCNALAVAADVGESAQVQAAVDAVISEFGGIDVLVNNAGIDTSSPVIDMALDVWDRMIAVNLRSVFLCTQAVLPGMI